jgi:putative DNA methylase
MIGPGSVQSGRETVAMMEPLRRKLIEVALPLEVINREAAREKSIRHGHPSTLHLWFARRPLAACRAVLFAQLVDDPSARPEEFPTVEAQDIERARLFDLIERLVPWEASTDQKVLDEAHAEIAKCFPDGIPPVLDPFAGGGSIPLEAQRLGLEAHASDLNPVPVLINKALIEIPPVFADRAPVNPVGRRARLGEGWTGAQGLADDVKHYGGWMRDRAEERIGHLYPKVTIPRGGQATVIAWIWARTVTCPNPACRSTMPLVRSFWLGKKKGKEAYVVPVPHPGGVTFEIGHGPGGPVEGTVGRTGARCLVCSSSVPLTHVRAEGKAGRMGAQLMAIAAEGDRRRIYLPPNDEHVAAADVPRPDDVPDTELPHNPRAFTTPNYGMTHHADLFTHRQLVALTTFCDLVGEAREQVLADALAAGDPDDGTRLSDGGTQATAYADAVATYLGLAVSRAVGRWTQLASWDSSTSKEQVRDLFSRPTISMNWDFAEANPLGRSSGNLSESPRWVADVLSPFSASSLGYANQANALDPLLPGATISTDPPYYDNIGYADLADFFYIWLRRCLVDYHGPLFGTILTPKASELVADPYRQGSSEAAEDFFEAGFFNVFTAARATAPAHVPMTVFYAFKQAETEHGSTASTGWETMLEGMLCSGWSITGTWPMRTELGNRMRNIDSNALASSIVLVCRPRATAAGVTDRRGFQTALRASLPNALRELQQGLIAPVDLAQASIGPGMAVFSSYAKVVESDGSAMTVRAALGLINAMLDEVLAEQEGEFDAETRWAVKWFEQHGYDTGKYGTAETLATAMAVSVDSMDRGGMLSSVRGDVRLLAAEDMPTAYDPATDDRVTTWEVLHHLIKRLDADGESAAGGLLAQVGGLAEPARDLAYRLFALCERTKRTSSALAFNRVITSWPDIARAAADGAPLQQAVQLGLV